MPYILWFQAAGIQRHLKLLHVHVCSDNEGNLNARLYYQLSSLQASFPFMAGKVSHERICERAAKL